MDVSNNADKGVKNQEDVYRNLVDHTPDPVIIVKNSIFVYANDAAVQLFGGTRLEELLGKSVYDLLHPNYVGTVEQRIKEIKEGRTVPFIEEEFYGIDGRVFEAEVKAIPTIYENEDAVHLILKDSEARKQTEALLIRSEKLAVAGQLAAGIAHEVRNPITAIKGFLQLMENSMKENKSYFDIIRSEIDRIELILSELLSLAKPQDMKMRKSDLNKLINQVTALIDTQTNMYNIEFLTVFESESNEIICDENQIKQVFINLLQNSIEAMHDDGTIIVEVRQYSFNKIQIILRDTGEGIPEHILKRVGEPFFTTKDHGTGLGLMISKQIIENHRGTLHIMSDENGTTIEIILPIKRPHFKG